METIRTVDCLDKSILSHSESSLRSLVECEDGFKTGNFKVTRNSIQGENINAFLFYLLVQHKLSHTLKPNPSKVHICLKGYKSLLVSYWKDKIHANWERRTGRNRLNHQFQILKLTGDDVVFEWMHGMEVTASELGCFETICVGFQLFDSGFFIHFHLILWVVLDLQHW